MKFIESKSNKTNDKLETILLYIFPCLEVFRNVFTSLVSQWNQVLDFGFVVTIKNV